MRRSQGAKHTGGATHVIRVRMRENEPLDPSPESTEIWDHRRPAGVAAGVVVLGIATALVLMMTGPGLALFYGGLVRRKNVLGTMMHSFILMAVVSVLWAVVGYSLAFGEGNPFVGGMQYLFLHGVGADPNGD